MQRGPVDKFLNITVERLALYQFKIEVSCIVKYRLLSGLTGDDGE